MPHPMECGYEYSVVPFDLQSRTKYILGMCLSAVGKDLQNLIGGNSDELTYFEKALSWNPLISTSTMGYI